MSGEGLWVQVKNSSMIMVMVVSMMVVIMMVVSMIVV